MIEIVYDYLIEYRNKYSIKVSEGNVGGCRNCKMVWKSSNDTKTLEYSSSMGYMALCKKCFYSIDVTLEQIVEFYTTRNSYESSFNQLEYNWMLDSIEEEIHSGKLKGKYEDYLIRKRESIIDSLIKVD